MAKHKHLSFEQRSTIQEMLNARCSFSEIASILEKDPSTISKEVRHHLAFRKVGYKFVKYNACSLRFSCSKTHICKSCNSDRHYKKCSNCPACNRNCKDFVEEICSKLLKPPYVCNGCSKQYSGCTLEKRLYSAAYAHEEYCLLRSESRSGISFSQDEILHFDEIVSPLLQKGQSPHHICVTNKDTLMISESTIYRLVDSGLFMARNFDLPRKIRFRKRKSKRILKVDKKCRIHRSYDDFVSFLSQNPDITVTELDSVEGVKGGKVLLTIHFVKTEMMLAFLRDHNDSQSVIDIMNHLYLLLGHELFADLFQVCLPDNGSEFSNPAAIEFNDSGLQRTRIFYCDPSAPYQKGSAERNHEFIRDFIPKGTDFALFSQDDISLMMDHINSYSRKSLGDKSPYEMFAFLYGQSTLDLLACHRIKPQDVTLNKSIFRKESQ